MAETTHSIQRKLIAKINNASNFIANDGRVGPAQYIVTNGNIASVIQDIAGYTVNPVNGAKLNTNGQLYPVGIRPDPVVCGQQRRGPRTGSRHQRESENRRRIGGD